VDPTSSGAAAGVAVPHARMAVPVSLPEVFTVIPATQTRSSQRPPRAVFIVATYVLLALGATSLRAFGQQSDSKSYEPPKDSQGKPIDGSAAASPDTETVLRLAKLRGKKLPEWSAEDIADFTAITYYGAAAQSRLSQKFNTGREVGRISLVTTNGTVEGEYTRRFVNGPTMNKNRVRLDLILETSPRPADHLRYSVVYNGATVWTAQNSQYVQADPKAAAAFKASIINDYTALFRYKDEGATLKRGGTQKVVGLDTELITLTRADGSTARFYISPKSFRILHVEYDVVLLEGEAPVTFRESYSEWRTFQESLEPAVRRLKQNNQVVQTDTISSATYSTPIDDLVFLQL
jgi:hypothetical protein